MIERPTPFQGVIGAPWRRTDEGGYAYYSCPAYVRWAQAGWNNAFIADARSPSPGDAAAKAAVLANSVATWLNAQFARYGGLRGEALIFAEQFEFADRFTKWSETTAKPRTPLLGPLSSIDPTESAGDDDRPAVRGAVNPPKPGKRRRPPQ